MRFVRRVRCLFLLLAFLAPTALLSQEKPPEKSPDRSLESLLPADTLVYASWHGESGMAEHKATNSLLQLWNDQDLAPARALLASAILAQDTKDLPPVTKDEITLLAGNPALVAYIKLPAGVKPHVKPDAPKAEKSSAKFEGALLILYDRTGREALVDRIMKWSPEGKIGAEITKSQFHGMEIQEQRSGGDANYRVIAGHYVIVSDYREVLELWATRLSAAAPARGSLTETAEFRAAHQRVGPGAAITAFFNLRVMFDELRANMKEEEAKHAWDALHFDRLHSVIGSVTLGDPATRFEFSLLGDLSPGNLTDLIGASGTDFPTLRMTPAGVFSYSAFRWDLSALYRFMESMFVAFAPPGQGVLFKQVDSQLTQQFGMSMNDMLKLLSGDFTMIKQESAGDLAESVFVLGVEKPADVQHVIELLFSSNITNQENIGDVTLLSVISPFGGPPPSGDAGAATLKPRGRYYCVALAPKMMVVAHRKAEAKAFLAQARALDTEKSLAGDPKFQAERARLPKSLSALSYADLSRVDWKEMVDKVASAQKVPIDPQKLELVKNMFPTAAFARHLHAFVTGMWKDRTGIYYDGYLE
ncbi:MAG TPA: hypothetical protein VEG63_12115 [Candidatus Acidoferrales bacterium]|nr:hypothetical protein [Candidatus Acidoferrales bacterium]